MSEEERRLIGELWRDVNKHLHDRFRHAFKQFDIPPTALILLRNLEKEPGLTVSELARRSGTVKSHVSKLVDQLVAQGFLEKQTDPADQRLIRVFITETTRKAKADMEERAKSLWAEVMDQVSPAELTQVENGLRILLQALERSNRSTT